MIHELHRHNLFMMLFRLAVRSARCGCHHTPIFHSINIIAVTTRNNLICDMHVSGLPLAIDVDDVCLNTSFWLNGARIAVSNIAPPTFAGIYWFNWTLIDDVRNRIIKRHLVCCFSFPVFCLSALRVSFLFYESIVETQKGKRKWIVSKKCFGEGKLEAQDGR